LHCLPRFMDRLFSAPNELDFQLSTVYSSQHISLARSSPTDYSCESLTSPLPYFAKTNSWFLTRNQQKQEVCDSRIHQNYKILISSSYFNTSQNGRKMLTNAGWCLRRFFIQFSKTGFTGFCVLGFSDFNFDQVPF
jgi:hypothetical protein